MAHCGFEGTAVNDAFAHPLKALKTALRGPRITGPMAPDLTVVHGGGPPPASVPVPVAWVKRASASEVAMERTENIRVTLRDDSAKAELAIEESAKRAAFDAQLKSW